MIEWIAVIASLICVYLTAKKDILCWPVGIVAIAAYSMIFYRDGLTGNLALQFVFLIQSIFGWVTWRYDIDKLKSVEDMGKRIIGIAFLFMIPAIYISYVLTSNGLDMITTALSMVALTLTTFKRWEAWIFWIIADILYVLLFYDIGELLPMINYIIFTLMATWGLIKWRKEHVIQNRRK